MASAGYPWGARCDYAVGKSLAHGNSSGQRERLHDHRLRGLIDVASTELSSRSMSSDRLMGKHRRPSTAGSHLAFLALRFQIFL
jgi:hypothetical protein